MMPIELPEKLRPMNDVLTAAGLMRTEAGPSPSFGDCLVEYVGSGLRIRLVRERGDWYVEAGRLTWEDHFPPEIWVSCLQRTELNDSAIGGWHQARLLIEHLDEMVASVDQAGLLDCMKSKRKSRVYRRLGLDEAAD
jgi:hypothetical protein